MVRWFESLSKVVRAVLLFPFWGWIFSALYRICKYVEYGKKSKKTLIVGILCIIPFIGFVVSVIDFVTTINEDKIAVLAE